MQPAATPTPTRSTATASSRASSSACRRDAPRADGRAEHPRPMARRHRAAFEPAQPIARARDDRRRGRRRERPRRAPRPTTRRTRRDQRARPPRHPRRTPADRSRETPRAQDAPHPPDAERLETDADRDAHPAGRCRQRARAARAGRRARTTRGTASGMPPTTSADIRAWADSARASAATASRSRSDDARPSSASADRPPTTAHIASAPATTATPGASRSRAHARSASASGAPSRDAARRRARSRPRAAPSPRATAVTAVAIVPPARSSAATWSTAAGTAAATSRARRPRADASDTGPPTAADERGDRRPAGTAAERDAEDRRPSRSRPATVAARHRRRRSSRGAIERDGEPPLEPRRHAARRARCAAREPVGTAKRRAARRATTSTDRARRRRTSTSSERAHARHTSSRSIARAPGRALAARPTRTIDRPARSSSEPGARHAPGDDLARPRRPRAARRARARPARSRRSPAASWARIAASGSATPESKVERLEPGERVGGRVGVHRRQRAVVAGVARLQHVERLAAAHLADDEPIGPHAQRGAHELAHAHRARAFGVRRAAPRAGRRGAARAAARRSPRSSRCVPPGRSPRPSALQHVVLPALVAPDTTMFQPARTIASRNALAGASSPNAASGTGAAAEAADRDARPVGRERRKHRVQRATVGQAGVDHRRRAVEAQPERRDHPFDDPHDRRRVDRARDPLDAARAFDVRRGRDRSP